MSAVKSSYIKVFFFFGKWSVDFLPAFSLKSNISNTIKDKSLKLSMVSYQNKSIMSL